MAYILCLETATKNCSVALADENGIVLALREYAGEGYAHAEKLHVFIGEVLEEADIEFEAVDAVAVSMGPGSYTGLRIGVSAAKGLCYALGVPMIAVNTLEVLAAAVAIDEGSIIPMIDARRMEVYDAIYDSSYTPIRETIAEVIDEKSFEDKQGPLHLCGDGAVKCKEVLTDRRFTFHDNVIYPSAKQLARLAAIKYKKSDTVDVAYFEPFYLKDFIAGKPAK